MSQNPEVEVMLNKMRAGMGEIPTAIEKVAEVDESLLFEHMRSSGYAMPPDGALDTQTRTLVYLAAALAAGSQPCIQAMANKAVMQKIPHDKLMETVKIVRYAMATRIIGEAEPIFNAMR
ncbi:MAG: carboxymuconolactone decarboxylase family protein [Thiotrichales bacterium]|jgi:alkylhydroperoxidase/carboxymuconolactone decarboxylase family protein YurZ|nr:carboxymuconolactone decarboxylase family protein [Thiotrichales bacterium]